MQPPTYWAVGSRSVFRFLSERGLRVALVELGMFAPVFAYALWPRRAIRSVD